MNAGAPIRVQFSTAFLDGYFEDAPEEVAKHWKIVSQYISAASDAVEALEPFAAYRCAGVPAGLAITSGSAMAKRQLTAGDCQRAYDAWSQLGADT